MEEGGTEGGGRCGELEFGVELDQGEETAAEGGAVPPHGVGESAGAGQRRREGAQPEIFGGSPQLSSHDVPDHVLVLGNVSAVHRESRNAPQTPAPVLGIAEPLVLTVVLFLASRRAPPDLPALGAEGEGRRRGRERAR